MHVIRFLAILLKMIVSCSKDGDSMQLSVRANYTLQSEPFTRTVRAIHTLQSVPFTHALSEPFTHRQCHLHMHCQSHLLFTHTTVRAMYTILSEPFTHTLSEPLTHALSEPLTHTLSEPLTHALSDPFTINTRTVRAISTLLSEPFTHCECVKIIAGHIYSCILHVCMWKKQTAKQPHLLLIQGKGAALELGTVHQLIQSTTGKLKRVCSFL